MVPWVATLATWCEVHIPPHKRCPPGAHLGRLAGAASREGES